MIVININKNNNDQVNKLHQAVGIVIQWPQIAIVLIHEQRTKQQNVTTSLILATTGGGTKNMSDQTTNKARITEFLRDHLKTNPVVNIEADSGIFQVWTYHFSVTHEDYFRLLRKQTTDLPIITTWHMILHSMVRTCVNKCAFLNPYKIPGEACQKYPEGVASYLVDAMRLHHGKLFLIAPYLQNKHWVLLVTCPRNRTVYVLDSLKKSVEKPVDTYCLLKRHVEM
uniref:Ubiquitin-like protease family profile domain-containing protein n=1 Tax=Lactuca sativa TaxID=4236 RepID=A0A9R1UJM5_LACSA|nr:hypothetical protein LSAT_V11C900497040 [Lactuca sativa]